MTLLNPYLLILAVAIPLLALYHIFIGRRSATLQVSTLQGIRTPRTLRYWLRPLPVVLRLAALALLIVAIARPVKVGGRTESLTEGIDIVLAMDISTSMLADDFTPNRLEASKHIADRFVEQRKGDRIAIVAFAGESFTQRQLTADQASVQSALGSLRCIDNYGRPILEDGTAIGNGLATAINRLHESDAKSKVVILLTDGANNRGEISPLTAAEIAADLGIKVYTIGMARDGMQQYLMAEVDEELMQQIASMTEGKYFRATDNKALQEIYDEINKMEKSKVLVTNIETYDELFLDWVLYALLLLVVEFLLRTVILNRLP